MNARGNSLLIEEKERNRVNKLLPKLEKELQDLIQGMDNMDIVGSFREVRTVERPGQLFG